MRERQGWPSSVSDGLGSLPDLRGGVSGAGARRLGLHPISASLLTSTCVVEEQPDAPGGPPWLLVVVPVVVV